jgi:hypothetical protein
MWVKLKCNVSANGKDYTIDDVVELDGETAALLIERGDANAASKAEVAAAKEAIDAAAKAAKAAA